MCHHEDIPFGIYFSKLEQFPCACFDFIGNFVAMSIMIRITAIVVAVELSMVGAAMSETTAYGSFVHAETVPNVLFLTGKISTSESFELRKAMREHDIKLVVAASPGGNLYEGLQIAAILHDNKIGTYVPEGAQCESSCANIFLGGSSRMLLGELGVHQFFSASEEAMADAPQSVTTAVTQYTTADIIGIMNEFDTPPFVYEKMFGTADIYYFKASEKARLNRNTEDSAFIEKIDAVDAFLATNTDLLLRPDEEPTVTATASVDLAPSSTPPVATLEEAALTLLQSINNDWSQPNDIALPRMATYYAPSVEFYGNTLSQAEVMQEKSTFAERWPLRSYAVEPNSVQVNCVNDGCVVDSIIMWQASSPARSANASGYSTWTLVLVPVDDRMMIASETGRTLKRN